MALGLYNKGMSYIEALKAKAHLRRRIKEYKRKNPSATLQQIGDKFNLTRQRISQILRDNNGGE